MRQLATEGSDESELIARIAPILWMDKIALCAATACLYFQLPAQAQPLLILASVVAPFNMYFWNNHYTNEQTSDEISNMAKGTSIASTGIGFFVPLVFYASLASPSSMTNDLAKVFFSLHASLNVLTHGAHIYDINENQVLRSSAKRGAQFINLMAMILDVISIVAFNTMKLNIALPTIFTALCLSMWESPELPSALTLKLIPGCLEHVLFKNPCTISIPTTKPSEMLTWIFDKTCCRPPSMTEQASDGSSDLESGDNTSAAPYQAMP